MKGRAFCVSNNISHIWLIIICSGFDMMPSGSYYLNLWGPSCMTPYGVTNIVSPGLSGFSTLLHLYFLLKKMFCFASTIRHRSGCGDRGSFSKVVATLTHMGWPFIILVNAATVDTWIIVSFRIWGCAACWALFLCHHELWVRSVSYPFWKTMVHLSYRVNTIATDVLAMKEAKSGRHAFDLLL